MSASAVQCTIDMSIAYKLYAYYVTHRVTHQVSSNCRNVRKKSGWMWQDNIFAAAATYISCLNKIRLVGASAHPSRKT